MTTSSNRIALVRSPRGAIPRKLQTTLAGAALRRIGQFFQLGCQSLMKLLKSCRRLSNLTRHTGKSFVSFDPFVCLHRAPSSEARFIPAFSL